MKNLIYLILSAFLLQMQLVFAEAEEKKVNDSKKISPEVEKQIARIKKLTEDEAFEELDRTVKMGNKSRLRVILHVYPTLLNRKDSFGRTPLYNAVFANKYELVKYLASKRAKISATDVNGDTPLHRAAAEGAKNILEILVKKGAFYYTKNNKGRTALFSAALQGEVEAAEFLLAQGDKINRKDKYGDTPLHMAAIKGEDKMVKFLLQSGADFNIENKKGKTPEDVAKNVAVKKLFSK